MRLALRLAVIGAGLAALAGCASDGSAPRSLLGRATPAPAALPVPEVSARDHIDRAAELLADGEAEAARAELQAALDQQPGHPQARSLLDQIDKDPVVLLGARNYPYRVKPGESLSQIAGRLLGDANLFYALARYNGVERPSALTAGQALKIPGVPKKAVAAKPTAAAAAAVATARDPGRANVLRGAALEHMSGGKIDRAVVLLRQAQELDPENALIRRDLDRARRIQSTVRGRS